MDAYFFGPSLSQVSLVEILSELDFKWPKYARSCMQLSDGEVVFLKYEAQEFNELRYQYRLDASNIMSKIKADKFVFPDNSRPMILNVVATDWNIAISPYQIMQKKLETLSTEMSHDEGVKFALKKAKQLRLKCQNSLNSVDVIIDPSLNFKINISDVVSTNFFFRKFMRTHQCKFNEVF
ncbi:hypothetical protein [Shewanella aestuarii]|uniref:Uncharacterized protein n=1 Tax=Shewanella aestuarii TaxID=1028752 RepID=A0A6G9QRC0_9GAMM|nr:hypothetical protein [Shewanella aestuarii]QIR16351.1 hypothetical protein HBH39_17855 [Shewanella aestuarii]